MLTEGDSKMTTNQQPSMYLKPRFKVLQYNFAVFPGPRAGEEAPDFTLTDQHGQTVKLSDFRGQWVVLETASATCSMYTKNIPGMKKLVEEFPDVEFLVVYVREAHPGERLSQHQSFQDKVKAASLLKPRYGEPRPVLIDTLEGDMHQNYGAMPNLVYVFTPEGKVHYRCNWATIDGVRKALLERDHIHTEENADLKKLWRQRKTWNSIRTMWTGGFLALWDFAVALPTLIMRHRQADRKFTAQDNVGKTG